MMLSGGYRLLISILRTIRMIFYMLLVSTIVITIAGIGVGIYAGTKHPAGWSVVVVFIIFGSGFGYILLQCRDAIGIIEMIINALQTDWSLWANDQRQSLASRMAPWCNDSLQRDELLTRMTRADEFGLDYVIDWIIDLIMYVERHEGQRMDQCLFICGLVVKHE
jgi:hypothetical protein